MPMFGGDSTKSSSEDHHPRGQKDHSDSVIDPALRSLASSPIPDKKLHENDSSLVNHQPSDHPSSMPLRVEQFQMSSPRRHFDNPHRLPSPPPPITTMSTDSHSPSPSVSVDRSSNSTPHIRRSPPHNSMQQQPAMYSTYQQHDPPMIQSSGRHHHSNHYSSRPEPISHGTYIYPSQNNNFDHPQPRYDHPQQHHQQHQQHHQDQRVYSASSGLAVPFPHHVSSAQHAQQQMAYENRQQYAMAGQPPVTIVHTDDAATKLTDGIRRRCFNCCTTDTSTWRRSNLSPGKVLCNKCGLFERTHSRPRPDQFPHKRGPLAASTLRGRTPPGSNQLPPISSGAQYQYHHQNITPLNTGDYHPNTLPGLQAWHGNNSTSSSSNGNISSSANSTSGGGSNAHNTSVGGPGGGGGGDNHGGNGSNSNVNNGSGSATGTPSLPSRKPISPRLLSHSSPRERVFEEPLSSNAAEARHPPSPPTAVSRSLTSNTTGGSSAQQESASASHTPPPAGSAREPAA